jgi:hypothetical protein
LIETVLNWFGVEDRAIKKLVKQRVTVMLLTFQILNHRLMFPVALRLIVEGLWDKIQDGLTLAIENVLFFIVFVRFVILAFYNLKLLSILHVSDFCRILMVQTFNSNFHVS